MELIPIITSFIVFTSYLVLVLVKLGVQKSISYSDVIQKKPFEMCFEFTMWICGACLIWFATINNILLTQIGGLCIIGVGFFTKITEKKWVYVAHMFFAIPGFALSFIGVYHKIYLQTLNSGYSMDSFILLCLVVLSTIIGVLALSEKKLFGVEVGVGYLIFIGMILIYLLIS